MSESYHKAKIGGISDGSAEGDRGASDYRISKQQPPSWAKSDSIYGPNPTDARNMGSGLLPIIGALFLHKYFCFVGFWLIGCVLLVSVANFFGLYNSPHVESWYGAVAVLGPAVIPVILAVLFRKTVPTVMKWALVVVVVGVPAAFVIGMIVHLQSR